MKYHAILFASLIALPSVFSSCYANEAPTEPEAANAVPEIQNPATTEPASNSPEAQKPGTAGVPNDNPEFQKPGEAQAIAAAIAYLNPDGKLTIQKSEFIAWGTYSEKHVYWPMKFRLTYKTKGSDTLRQSEYAVKISRDNNGKLKAETYYAWRTDFK